MQKIKSIFSKKTKFIYRIYQDVFPDGNPAPFAEQMFRVYDTDKNGTVDFQGSIFSQFCLGTFRTAIIFRIHLRHRSLGQRDSGSKIAHYIPNVRRRQ